MVNEMSLQKKNINGITIIFQNIYEGEPPTIDSPGAQFTLSVYFYILQHLHMQQPYSWRVFPGAVLRRLV